MLHERPMPFAAKSEPETRIGEDDEAILHTDSGNESAETDSDAEEKLEGLDGFKNELVGMNVSKVAYSKILAIYQTLTPS